MGEPKTPETIKKELITDEQLIPTAKALFDYLVTYGTKKNPSEDGLTCHEQIIKKGEVERKNDYGYARQFRLVKIIDMHCEGNKFISVSMDVTIGAREIVYDPEKDGEAKHG